MALTTRDVAVVTPWYPSQDVLYGGAFVQAMVEATAPRCDRLTVYHCDAWVAGVSARTLHWIRRAWRELLPLTRVYRPTAGGATIRHVPMPMWRRNGHADVARQMAAGLHLALGHAPLPQPVVHAHVGLPGGWSALHNARPDARVFVTEHASYLANVLADPAAREMYDELLHRCAGFFAVGDGVRLPLLDAFPHHEAKIASIGNPISFTTPRPEPVRALRRWLAVGTLSERKRPDLVLEAFAKCRTDDRELTLTLVGDGPLDSHLRDLAVSLDVADAVVFTGSLPPAQTLRLMRTHDLLVHASRWETFGVTIVEAIAAGMPVLVTRCGAPERTLVGIERAAGEIVDVDESADGLVGGYRRLRQRFPDDLDLDRARAVLADQFGYDAVGRSHEQVWFAQQPVRQYRQTQEVAAPVRVDRRVLFLALGGTRRRAVTNSAAGVIAAGGEATVVVDGAASWGKPDLASGAKGLAAGVSVLDVAPRKVQWPLRYGRRLLFGIPRRASRLLGRGGLAPAAQRAYTAYWRRIGAPAERRLLLPAYRRLSMRTLPRLVRRQLRGRAYDLVVIADPVSLPAGSRLVRRHRGAVLFDIPLTDLAALADLAAEDA